MQPGIYQFRDSCQHCSAFITETKCLKSVTRFCCHLGVQYSRRNVPGRRDTRNKPNESTQAITYVVFARIESCQLTLQLLCKFLALLNGMQVKRNSRL